MEIIRFNKGVACGLFLVFWIALLCMARLPFSIEGWAAFIPLRCPLYALFKITCPTCGLGRSLVAAAMGQWGSSWHYHPLGLPIFWGGQGFLLCGIFSPARRERWIEGWQNFLAQHQRGLWIAILAYGIWGFWLRSPI